MYFSLVFWEEFSRILVEVWEKKQRHFFTNVQTSDETCSGFA